MERKTLLDKLEAVSPALSSNVLIPVFTCFWFTGKRVLAYNDHISISAELPTDFDGAVGGTLSSLINASRATKVEMEVEDGVLIVKAATSKFKLPVMEAEKFKAQFTMPKIGEDLLPVRSEAFVQAIEDCLVSVSVDTAVPDYQGITMLAEGNQLYLFSSNTKTMNCSTVVLKGNVPFKRAILRGDFCKQLVRFGKGHDIEFQVSKDYAIFAVDDVVVYGRLLRSDNPQDFMETYDYYLPTGIEGQLVTVPTKLELMLERAIIVSSGTNPADEVRTKVSVEPQSKGEGPRMFFHSVSTHGEVEDSVELEKGAPSVEVKLSAKLMKEAYGNYTHMVITKEAAIFADADMSRVLMVAANK